jgi:hypothetical protein
MENMFKLLITSIQDQLYSMFKIGSYYAGVSAVILVTTGDFFGSAV